MNILWSTDIHFNLCVKQHRCIRKFLKRIEKHNPDALVISGDISTGRHFEKHISQLAKSFGKPIYFVLGNHDYWKSSWEDTTSLAIKLSGDISNLFFLDQDYYEFDNHVICGTGGWYDAFYGNTNSTPTNDIINIFEMSFCNNNRYLLIDIIRKQAKKEADKLAVILNKACQTNNEVIVVVTHIPPYIESSWHEGEYSDRNNLPWYVSKSTGDVIDTYSEQYSNKQFMVLCGHTHSPGIYKRQNNLTIYTGKAVYGLPDSCGVINIEKRTISCYNSSNEKIEQQY